MCQGLCPSPWALCLPSFVLSLFVSHVLCQGLCRPPWALCPPMICLPSFVFHHVLCPRAVSRHIPCQGLCVSPAWASASPIIRRPGPVSGAVSASLALCLPSFVSHHLSPRSCVTGCVRLPGLCVYHHYVPKQFTVGVFNSLVVSSSFRMSRIHMSALVAIAFVSQSRWWCPSSLAVSNSCCLTLAVSNSFVSPFNLNLKASLLLVCTAGFIVSDSLDVFLYLSSPLPPCLSPTLALNGLVRVPGCLSSDGLSLLVSFHLFAGSQRLVVSACSLCIHMFPIMFLLPSFSGFIYLSPNSSVFNHQSASAVVADSFACLPLRGVFHRLFLIMCLPLHGSSHSYVPLVAVSCSCFSTFSFVISPLSLFLSPLVSSCSLSS